MLCIKHTTGSQIKKNSKNTEITLFENMLHVAGFISLNWNWIEIEKCLFEKPKYKYKEDIKTVKAGFPKWTHRSIIDGL